MNSIFGIKNTKFIIGFKKMTKVMCLATKKARLALTVIVDDGLWQSSMAGINDGLWQSSMAGVHNPGY